MTNNDQFEAHDENYNQQLVTQEEITKMSVLLDSKSEELNLNIIEVLMLRNKDLIILAKRNFNGLYCVWDAYHTGELETSYRDFHNGDYDMSLREALDEFERRHDNTQNNEKPNTTPFIVTSDIVQ